MNNRIATVAAFALLAATPAVASAANGFTPNLHLVNPQSPAVLSVQDVEPALRVDSTGRIFVSAIRGVPAGTDLFEVAPSGLAFAYRGQPDGLPMASAATGAAPGGGDTDMAIGSFTQAKPGPLLVTALNLGSVYASQTSDGGLTYTQSPNAAGVIFGDDRQWNAAQGGMERYDVVHDIATDSIEFARSMDGGLTWINGTPTTLSNAPIGLRSNNIGEIVVDPVHQILYNVYVATASQTEALNNQNPNATHVPNHTVWVAKSTDDGTTWTSHIAYNGPTTESYGHLFPTIAVDYVGNVFVGWCDGRNISVTYSTDGADTFAAPYRVTGGIGDAYKTHIFPWLAAAGRGGVDLSYYETTAASPDDVTGRWVVGFSQNLDVPRHPAGWTSTVASDHIVHVGQVCQGGVGCTTGGNRRLSDDFQIAVDPQGYANIAFTDDSAPGAPQTFFTKQVVGSLLPRGTSDDGEVENFGCSEDGDATDTSITTSMRSKSAALGGVRSALRVKAPTRTTPGWMTFAVGSSIVASGPLSAYHPTSETSATIAGRTLAGVAFVGTIAGGTFDLSTGTRSYRFAAHRAADRGTQRFARFGRTRADGTGTTTGSCHLD